MTEPVARAASWLVQVAQATIRRASAAPRLARCFAAPRCAGTPARRALATDLGRIGAVCALLWGGIGPRLHEQHASALREATHDTRNLARAFEENTARTVEAMDHLLLFLRSAYRSNPTHFDIAAWEQDAEAFDDLIRRVGILDRAGRVLATVPALVTPSIDASDREYFRAQRDSVGDALRISAPLIGRESRRWVVHVARQF